MELDHHHAIVLVHLGIREVSSKNSYHLIYEEDKQLITQLIVTKETATFHMRPSSLYQDRLGLTHATTAIA